MLDFWIDNKQHKQPWWQRLLGRLGFKKYRRTYFYGMDYGSVELHSEVTSYVDADGVFNVVDMKVREVQK